MTMRVYTSGVRSVTVGSKSVQTSCECTMTMRVYTSGVRSVTVGRKSMQTSCKCTMTMRVYTSGVRSVTVTRGNERGSALGVIGVSQSNDSHSSRDLILPSTLRNGAGRKRSRECHTSPRKSSQSWPCAQRTCRITNMPSMTAGEKEGSRVSHHLTCFAIASAKKLRSNSEEARLIEVATERKWNAQCGHLSAF